MKRRQFIQAGALGAGSAALLPLLKHLPARATPADTLVVAIGNTINSMDIHRTGTNRPSYQIAVNLYDRLISFGTKTLEDGSLSYDYQTLVPELAESWRVAEDNSYIDFRLKPEATFWDGKPVTAHDVKWSFDRAVSVGGFPTVQMKAGNLASPEQFKVVDDRTFRIYTPEPSKLTLPDLAVPVPIVINATVARQHATADDPWATEYLHRNPAGSGAFKLEAWRPGEMTVYVRNDDWAGGPLPAMRRVIIREVPSAATRRALLERGDIDINVDVKAKDALELQEAGRVKVVGTPIENSLAALGLNVAMAPFDDKRVRRAIAHAIPYREIFTTAAYSRGVPMWGGPSTQPADIRWPQPFPYDTDYEQARALLAEAGLADGFESTLSINLGLADWQEPAALLIQESLARVGIRVQIDKIPGANWRTRALVEKSLPMHMKNFGG
ncbi:MAG: ABC transporter substrate-binding protein, partial [Candidatus Competibacterales bacterium]|nr:ABC transporter substrate-binding protein [Candidatus Competibacterales bacterium]